MNKEQILEALALLSNDERIVVQTRSGRVRVQYAESNGVELVLHCWEEDRLPTLFDQDTD